MALADREYLPGLHHGSGTPWSAVRTAPVACSTFLSPSIRLMLVLVLFMHVGILEDDQQNVS